MITLQLSQAEVQALVGLLDQGVRAAGLRGVKEGAVLLDKIEKAVEASNKEVETPVLAEEAE